MRSYTSNAGNLRAGAPGRWTRPNVWITGRGDQGPSLPVDCNRRGPVRVMYGCGLRPAECSGLRVKDVDLDRERPAVRGGKGNKDRAVMRPKGV